MGLITLPIFAVLIWLTVSGCRDFYYVGRASSRRLVHFAWFLPLAAVLGVMVFFVTVFLLSLGSWNVYSFALALAVANIGGLWILSMLFGLFGARRGVISNAFRAGAGFLLIYYGFGEQLARLLGAKFSSV